MTDICIVPGHAILKGDNPLAESDWILEPFQRDGGHHVHCFLAHIKAGLAWLESNPHGRLVLSGGLTRPQSPRSEAASYLLAAQKCGYLSSSTDIQRIILEEFARDSLENLLYGIAAGFAATRFRIPRVTVIGFDFKRDRFFDHFASLKLGRGTTFDYIGINNPIEPQLSEAIAAESRVRAAFASILPEVRQSLKAKRDRRSWPGRKVLYADQCREWPDLHRILIEWDSANP